MKKKLQKDNREIYLLSQIHKYCENWNPYRLKLAHRHLLKYRRNKGKYQMNIYEAYLELLNDKIIETDIGDIIFQSSESFTFKKRFYKICESDVSDNALIPFDELDIEDIAVELEEIPLSAFKYNFTSYEPEEFKAKWEASRKKLNVKENRG